MLDFIIRHNRLSALLLGAISIWVFAPWFWLWAGFVGFGGLMFLLQNKNTKKELFACGYCFGVSHFACGFSWIGNALLLDAEKFGWVYPIALAALGLFFGLFAAFPALFTYYANNRWQKWLMFGGMWVIFEWLRSFLLTGFPWNLLGYSWAFDSKLMQIASIGGVYTCSLGAVLTYSLSSMLLDKSDGKRWLKVIVLEFLLLVSVYSYGYWRETTAKTEETNYIVRIVQPSIPQNIKWSKEQAETNFQKYVELSKSNSDNKPDMVIWGETASPFMLDRDELHRLYVTSVLPPGGLLITGMISYHYNQDRYMPYNSIAVIDAQGNVRGYYHKSHLVPFGEYIPWRKYLPSFLRPIANTIGQFGQGKGPSTLQLNDFPSIGGAVCYEIIFPHSVIDQKQRPDVLVNVTNDGWYGDSAGPYQHWTTVKFRAVEEGITIIRAANNGISGMINAYGQEKGIMSHNQVGVSDITLEKSLEKSTVYCQYGNKIILILCLILIVCGVIRRRN